MGFSQLIFAWASEDEKSANWLSAHRRMYEFFGGVPHVTVCDCLKRGLRIEKCMLSSSKFRKNRNGRAVLDVLRTINSTCTAAGIDPTNYLRFVFKHGAEVHDYPEKFTPYAVARSLEVKPQTGVVEPTMTLS